MKKSNVINEFGLCVYFDEIEVHLTQQAHCDTPLGACWDYQATGKDKNDNEYLIKWEMKDCYNIGNDELYDESDACNWDIYTIEAI